MDIFFYLPSVTCPTSYLCYRKSKYPSAFWPLTFIPLMWLKLDARPDPTSVNSTAASKPALDDAGEMGNSLSVSHLGVGNSAYGSQRYGIPDFGIDLPELRVDASNSGRCSKTDYYFYFLASGLALVISYRKWEDKEDI
ncbi:hypothetical protein SDJN03_18649, partial [Cucurbita argyrosperma subsp. sororia]